jgi:tetratricopeptide (TPR) repeat protein
LSYNLECLDNSSIDAEYDYWGNNGHMVNSDQTSVIDDRYDLQNDPWGTQNIASVKPPNSNSGEIPNKSAGSDSSSTINPSQGIVLEDQGKIIDAVNFYKDLIANGKFEKIALSQLARIKSQYNRNGIADYFDSLSGNQKYYPILNKLAGDAYLRNDQFENAINAYNNVIRTDSSGEEGISARFEELYSYLIIKKDISAANKILADIKEINSQSPEVQMRIKNAEHLINGSNKTLNKNAKLVSISAPKSYELSQNFPNPFNPSTTIRYQIPKPSLVTLKVYDILGREVATLVNENKIEGSYDFSFNASRFASGVYIYQLRVNDFVASKKMLLLK